MHPSSGDLRRMLDGELLPRARSEEIAVHLDRCVSCQSALLNLPTPPHRIFGRPVHQASPASPDVLKTAVRRLADLITESRGRAVLVAGNWQDEPLVYEAVSIAAARACRTSGSRAYRGALFRGGAASAPGSELAVLLDAPRHAALEAWRRPQPHQTFVLIGEANDWSAIGCRPDVEVTAIPDQHRLQRAIDQVLTAAHSSDPAVRAAVLANALHLDWRADLIPPVSTGPANSPFIQVCDDQGAAYSMVCVAGGAWLAGHVVGEDRRLSARDLDMRLLSRQAQRYLKRWGPVLGTRS